MFLESSSPGSAGWGALIINTEEIWLVTQALLPEIPTAALFLGM